MDTKIQDEERRQFSDRLRNALQACGYGSSPTAFAQEFNLRADGATVTVHGARKWLFGEAIPTQARVQVLAEWLNISAAWLRFGDPDSAVAPSSKRSMPDIDSAELRLLKDFRRLPEHARTVVRDLVDSLLRNAPNLD